MKQATKSVDVSKSVSAAVGSVSKSIDISKALPSVSVSKGSPVSVDVSKFLPSVSVSKSAAVAAPASTASFSKSFEVSHCCAAVLARAAMSCFLAIWHLVGSQLLSHVLQHSVNPTPHPSKHVLCQSSSCCCKHLQPQAAVHRTTGGFAFACHAVCVGMALRH